MYGLPADRLYASYFEGDAAQGLPVDEEARDIWLRFLPKVGGHLGRQAREAVFQGHG